MEYAYPTLKQIILNKRKSKYINTLEKEIINSAIEKNNLRSMNRISILCQLFLFSLLSTSALWAQSPKNKIDGVAAVVGDYLILETDIDRALVELKSQNVDTKNVTRCQLLGKLMEDKLYVSQAIQDSIKISDNDIREGGKSPYRLPRGTIGRHQESSGFLPQGRRTIPS